MTGDTLERARGRWRDILAALGIDSQYLRNKKGPCPMCGGKDRYRWDDKDGTGSYYCNQCGPGSGVTLLCKKHKWSFKQACDEIDRVIGNARYQKAEPPRDLAEKRRADINAALAGATQPELVVECLHRRGLTVIPPLLKGHPGLAYFDENKRPAGAYPAMVAPVTGPDGELQSVHRIYLTDAVPKAQRKKLMAPIGTIAGGAVRLFDFIDTLGISEGIETGIAAHELFGVPVWPTISTSGIVSFVVPPAVRRLIIFADNDSNFAGQRAAYTLANKIMSVSQAERTVHTVEVQVPPKVDTDWLDVLLEERGA